MEIIESFNLGFSLGGSPSSLRTASPPAVSPNSVSSNNNKISPSPPCNSVDDSAIDLDITPRAYNACTGGRAAVFEPDAFSSSTSKASGMIGVKYYLIVRVFNN